MKSFASSLLALMLLYALMAQSQAAGSPELARALGITPNYAAKAPVAPPPLPSTPAKGAPTKGAPAPTTATGASAPAPTPLGNSTDQGPAIPVSTQQNTGPGALDFYYLLWNNSYSAGDKLPIHLIVNPGSTAPAQVSISIFDEFNKIKLTDIATSAPLQSPGAGTPFPVYTWTVPQQLPANFNFTSGYFTLQVSWNDAGSVTKDRRIRLNNVLASPGGGTNPAMIAPSTTSSSNGTSSNGGTSATSGTNPKKSVATPTISTMTRASLWAFVITQLIVVRFSR